MSSPQPFATPLSLLLEEHLSAQRLGTYVQQRTGRLDDALDLYVWNSAVAAAFWEQLGHVGLTVTVLDRVDVALRHLDASLVNVIERVRVQEVASPRLWGSRCSSVAVPDPEERVVLPEPAPDLAASKNGVRRRHDAIRVLRVEQALGLENGHVPRQ